MSIVLSWEYCIVCHGRSVIWGYCIVCHGRPSPSLRGFLRWPCHRCSSVLVAIRPSLAEGKLLLNRVSIVLSGRGEKARAGGQTLGQEGKLYCIVM